MKKCNALTHSINDNWANIFYIRPFQNYPQRNEKLVSYIILTLQ